MTILPLDNSFEITVILEISHKVYGVPVVATLPRYCLFLISWYFIIEKPQLSLISVKLDHVLWKKMFSGFPSLVVQLLAALPLTLIYGVS